LKNIKEIITSIISSDPKPIINVVQADGDVTFHIKLKECNISKEDCTNSLLFTRFFVNFIGEFLVRQNIDIFASILIGLDHALYQKMVCTCSHHDFGMIIGPKFSTMLFQMHISLAQSILTEEFTKEYEINAMDKGSLDDFDASKPNTSGNDVEPDNEPNGDI
jgi:hypothetical protein